MAIQLLIELNSSFRILLWALVGIIQIFSILQRLVIPTQKLKRDKKLVEDYGFV